MNEDIKKEAENLVNAMVLTNSHMSYEMGQRCALIACELLIDNTSNLEDLEHWKSVKQAIEKL